MSEKLPPHEPSYTVDEFCAAERISRVKLYEMWKLGHGPRFYLNGRCRRITHKARLDWQAEREAEVEWERTRPTNKTESKNAALKTEGGQALHGAA
jgi:hypothetical protein